MSAWYNENDEDKAAWLRELIRQRVVADGIVDTRSIKEVEAGDLAGFAQCHFFAGIGVWSYALRLAGWPDDRPVWTGSCPCPSFSAAGKGGGFNDARHRWPDWARLIRVGKPATIFGEQADDAVGYGWLDLVQTDLERENYAVGKAVLGACSVGAPHIRQRLYFLGRRLTGGVAHSEVAEAFARPGEISARARKNESDRPGIFDADGRGFAVRRESGERQRDGEQCGADVGMGDSECGTAERWRHDMAGPSQVAQGEARQREWFRTQSRTGSHVNGFWRDADWILRKRWNRDDWEWCPTEPGTFPLVAGAPARVLRLRGYGDAICAPLAAEFIRATAQIEVT